MEFNLYLPNQRIKLIHNQYINNHTTLMIPEGGRVENYLK